VHFDGHAEQVAGRPVAFGLSRDGIVAREDVQRASFEMLPQLEPVTELGGGPGEKSSSRSSNTSRWIFEPCTAHEVVTAPVALRCVLRIYSPLQLAAVFSEIVGSYE
jgi:hypothetical protein